MVTINESTSAFADRISKLVENAKHNTQWRKQYMDWEREKAVSFRMGAQQKAVEDARSFYSNGVSIEIIAKSLHMTEEQIREIVNKQSTMQS